VLIASFSASITVLKARGLDVGQLAAGGSWRITIASLPT
jgi:hypothetical protein